MDEDMLGDFEPDGSEIPNGQDACLHHFIGHLLRHLCRGCDDAQVDAHALGKIDQIVEGQDCFFVDPLTDFAAIGVESGDYAETEPREAFMAEKRRA
jgi:hypothetical protein